MVNLGDLAKDVVTGFTGIAVAKCDWLHGCARLTLQPKVGKDGKLKENATFDEMSLIVVKKSAVKRGDNKTGGSQNDAASLRKN